MSVRSCPGCGRAADDVAVACSGCGRALSGGGAVPPGWEVAVPPPMDAVPEWQLAGIQTARPGPNDTIPRESAELFRPAAPQRTPAPEWTRPGGPGWRIRDRRPAIGALVTAQAMPVAVVGPPQARRMPRLLYWLLVAGIVASSASAVLIVTVHVLQRR